MEEPESISNPPETWGRVDIEVISLKSNELFNN